jgi:ferredoxin
MSDRVFISAENLGELIAALAAAETRVVAPSANERGETAYRAVTDIAQTAFNAELPMPSLKGHFLPQSETLLSFRQHGGDIEIVAAPTEFAPQVVLGARPCDVAALEVVDAVMNWDYHDELWNGRRRASTVISMACPGVDESCFCTAVGNAPDSARGADGLLTPVEGGFLGEFSTEKGKAFLGEYGRFFSEVPASAAEDAAASRTAARELVERNLSIDTARVGRWIDGHFDDSFWPTLGPRCNGCGACASVCPTCHCFDIVDEQEGVGAGVRRRNWDTCQSSKFTVHASGHNPRDDQNSRHRQRISHKFYIYPSKFGDVLCTGCGRCVRACPTGQDLVEILQTIDGLGRAEEEGAA